MPTPNDNANDINNTQPNGSSDSMNTTKRPGSIEEALRLLDDAIKGDTANLKELISSEYSNLRQALNDMAPRMGDNFKQYGTQAAGAAREYASQGIEQGRVIAGQVDSQVRQNPWPFIGGVALGSLALGFFLGKGTSAGPDITTDYQQ